MLMARLRVLGKLKPRFLWHTGDDSCDKAAVDAYLETMRTLAVRDMAALQAFIAATPRVFPASPGGGYVSAGVSNYFACIDRAMREYVQETGPYARKLPAPSVQFRSQRLEAARSKFLSQIKARLPDAGDQAGYGRPAVDRFLSDLRELAVGDIVRLLAFRATAPGFPVVAQGGYFIASVDNFMTRFRRAVNEYVTAVSETI